jgi:hypothetical protein
MAVAQARGQRGVERDLLRPIVNQDEIVPRPAHFAEFNKHGKKVAAEPAPSKWKVRCSIHVRLPPM